MFLLDDYIVFHELGYLPESAPLYHDMLVQEYLAFTAGMRGLEGKHKQERIRRVPHGCAILDVLMRADRTLDELTRSREQVVHVSVEDPDTARGVLERAANVQSVRVTARENRFTTFRLTLDGAAAAARSGAHQEAVGGGGKTGDHGDRLKMVSIRQLSSDVEVGYSSQNSVRPRKRTVRRPT